MRERMDWPSLTQVTTPGPVSGKKEGVTLSHGTSRLLAAAGRWAGTCLGRRVILSWADMPKVSTILRKKTFADISAEGKHLDTEGMLDKCLLWKGPQRYLWNDRSIELWVKLVLLLQCLAYMTLDSLEAQKYEPKNNNSKDLHSTSIYQTLY